MRSVGIFIKHVYSSFSMTRIAVVDNNKLRDPQRKKHIQSLCPVNRTGVECMYFEGSKLLIDEKTCIGCGICVNAAPEAIHVINLPEELTTAPIHRFGKNGFALYNLPTPLYGKVVGILGINGIGKSTAIKVLAGVLKPNFGNLEKEQDIKQLLKYYKGTESQRFFERIVDGSVKIAYKPQQVELISKTVKGTVEVLLKHVDERGKFSSVIGALDLKHVLNRELHQLSGGELQRVAIAATALKNAQLFIFDEPTSYLDIKQRVNVARFIRTLATPETSVLVIEHDLVALDYMTDLVHIMYGQAACYGIVSQLRATKTGMNTYLEGYLKEENVRFRDHKIKFDIKAPVKETRGQELLKWSQIGVKLGAFGLTVNPGILGTHEIVGILGENGIGKTTFAKVLAGVIDGYRGEITKTVRISYKPQYIEFDPDEAVAVLLQDAITKHPNDLIKPLNVEYLLDKKVNELSGGELQRVAIVHCLSQEADVYLLDEPSAYLDVEQRLVVASLIRSVMELRGTSALVVDHDLVFLDYVCNRLMVFNGLPGLSGEASGPFSMQDGMNSLLGEVKITLRRDDLSGRPRINKEGSVLDREQKEKGKYYYA